MSNDLNNSAKCFIGEINDNIVGFCAVLHFPHPKVKNIKRVHRLVVLPDFQGLGIGHAINTAIAQIYKSKGFRFRITGSNKSLFFKMKEDTRWKIDRKGRSASITKKSKIQGLRESTKFNSLSYSYEYIGK